MLQSFHPSNKANQRKLWMAEQKEHDDLKREKERQAELAREHELVKNRQLVSKKKIDKINAKAQQQMSFMYMPPPGFKREMEEDEENRKKTKAEEDVEKFPFLKDAPVEGQYTDNIQVHHKPFGIEVRNVKCARCHQWGHQSGDRECPLKNVLNPNDAERQKMEDPLLHSVSLFERDITGNNDGLVLKRKCLSPVNRGIEDNQQMIAEPDVQPVESDDDDIEREFLASLTRKQRKLLLKEFKREERRKHKKHKTKKAKKEVKD